MPFVGLMWVELITNHGGRSVLAFWSCNCRTNESGPRPSDDMAAITALEKIGNGKYSNP